MDENNKNNDAFIKNLRSSIDEIDEKIIHLINQRLSLAFDIGKAKLLEGKQIFDSARESIIIQRLNNLNKGLLKKEALLNIFTEIISACREIQGPLKISYLGPEATFSHIAALSYFGRLAFFIPQSSFSDIFDDVEKGTSNYGVVPVENSIEGAINYTLDLFFESKLKICGEKYVPISHDLLVKSGDLKDITEIYSHPQVFPQCRKWLKKYLPNVSLKECSSTAHAAKQAAITPNSAAISSSEAAHIYNLKVVASKIEDHSRNTTRFLIIGNDEIKRTGTDKTSLIFVTSHIPGALYKVLEPIAKANINMLKLESRPTKYENWSYFFIVDLEGHIEDSLVRETISKMQPLCLYLKCLGSYPRGEDKR
ncbi:MAG: prephenate dehydratase [Desulfobacterales bacterium]|nr:prephenate dehydratase [Desulfobacterales bacterium]MBF0398584.1 prephenate dehydratase [Desulfobacterales bacterium]